MTTMQHRWQTLMCTDVPCACFSNKVMKPWRRDGNDNNNTETTTAMTRQHGNFVPSVPLQDHGNNARHNKTA